MFQVRFTREHQWAQAGLTLFPWGGAVSWVSLLLTGKSFPRDAAVELTLSPRGGTVYCLTLSDMVKPLFSWKDFFGSYPHAWGKWLKCGDPLSWEGRWYCGKNEQITSPNEAAYLCFSGLIITSSFWSPNQRIPPHVEQLFVKVGLFQENLQLSSALSPSCWEIGEKSTIFHLSIRILARALRMVAGQGTNSSFSSSMSFGFASLT